MRARPYRLRLKEPPRLAGGGVLTHREGLLVFDPESGGVGDAAPLPGFSSETFPEIQREVEQAEWWETTQLPSLRFAVECARQGPRTGAGSVQLNALWWAGRESVADLLHRLRAWKDPVVKIKPGPSPQPEDWIRICRERPDARIRLDPNRSWTVEDLRRFTADLPSGQLEYVEEPLARMAEYADLPDAIPIALDESIREFTPAELPSVRGVKALVMKPTLMGNVRDREPWLQAARDHDWDVVWSSSFESGVGIWHLARLAAGGVPAGLDTAAALAEDVVEPRPLAAEDGRLGLTAWGVVKGEG